MTYPFVGQAFSNRLIVNREMIEFGSSTATTVIDGERVSEFFFVEHYWAGKEKVFSLSKHKRTFSEHEKKYSGKGAQWHVLLKTRGKQLWGFSCSFFPKRRNAPWEESPLTVQVLPGDVANKTLIQTFDVHQSHKFSNSPLEPKITNIPHGRHWRNVVTKKNNTCENSFFFVTSVAVSMTSGASVIYLLFCFLFRRWHSLRYIIEHGAIHLNVFWHVSK